MKYIELFEKKITNRPKRLDYVIVKISQYRRNVDPELADFFDNNIGKITGVDWHDYKIKFDKKLPTTDNYYLRDVRDTQIEYYSSDKKDVEMYLMAKKYNL